MPRPHLVQAIDGFSYFVADLKAETPLRALRRIISNLCMFLRQDHIQERTASGLDRRTFGSLTEVDPSDVRNGREHPPQDMPILDQLIEANPHAFHSLDPQADVDMAEMKRLCGDQFCLIGNVNCGLMDTGTVEEVRESARYALKHGMPGGGYIFSTSNCIYTGMKLERYDVILDVWRQEGNY